MFKRKDLLGLKDLTKDEITRIISLASDMKRKIDSPHLRDDSLKHSSIVTLFYENSTRTKVSFMMAAGFLGAKINDLGVATSSVNKGETLIDTGMNLDQMGINAMIVRHSMSGAAHVLARNVTSSVINAGDGTNEHPTQALLDLFTIHERLGGFDGIKVAIMGDITHSRVARSNVFGLIKLGAKVVLAGPSTLISESMRTLGAEITTKIPEAVADADVVMGLRIQKEREKAAPFPSLREYSSLFGITPEILKYAKKDALVMHPGPVNRGVELSADVIDGKQSVIYIQVKNGLAVRMAILQLLLGDRSAE